MHTNKLNPALSGTMYRFIGPGSNSPGLLDCEASGNPCFGCVLTLGTNIRIYAVAMREDMARKLTTLTWRSRDVYSAGI